MPHFSVEVLGRNQSLRYFHPPEKQCCPLEAKCWLCESPAHRPSWIKISYNCSGVSLLTRAFAVSCLLEKDMYSAWAIFFTNLEIFLLFILVTSDCLFNEVYLCSIALCPFWKCRTREQWINLLCVTYSIKEWEWELKPEVLGYHPVCRRTFCLAHWPVPCYWFPSGWSS